MEGCATSVNEAVILPAQPTAGAVEYVPLGGDGFTAPRFAYSIVDMQVTGDATAGHAGLTVTMDSRFCSLVSYVTIENQQATSADAEVRAFIAASGVPGQVFQALIVATSATIAARTIGVTWNPTPFILPGSVPPNRPRIVSRMLNVDTDEYFLNAFVFCFDIRVRETTPMGPLLWARGST